MMIKQVVVILAMLLCSIHSTVVVVNGGQIQINGAITNTQIDIMVNYTANVQWLAIIFSPDEVNADVHLLEIDTNNVANPVKVRDAYLDQTSAIKMDDISNIQPSITSFTGSITNGIYMAYNRDLATGDSNDLRFYPNEVIQICFISSSAKFRGNGYETGHQKICSFFSLHQNLEYFQDRLMGNFAGTTLLGDSNLTLYETQSTVGSYDQSQWIFVSIVHKQQGLTPYNGRWIGLTYSNSVSNSDLTVVEYGLRNFTKKVHTRDMYYTNSTYANDDLLYTLLQGSNDIQIVAGAVDQASYLMVSFKRKYITGDSNRDIIVEPGNHQHCVILGNNFLFNNFTQVERVCLSIDLKTSYYKKFRVNTDENGNTVQQYKSPNSTVVVVKFGGQIMYFLTIIIVFLVI